jgi:hypothetical protein
MTTKWHSRKSVAERYDCDPRTICRWELDPELLGPATYFNGRAFHAAEKLEAFDQRMAARGRKAAKTFGAAKSTLLESETAASTS